MRKTVTVKCTGCAKDFEKLAKYVKYDGEGCQHFCSIDCIKNSRTKSPNVECAVCKIPVKVAPIRLKRSKSGDIFCSHACSNVLRNAKYSGELHHAWQDDKTVYRKRALDHYGKFCHNEDCALTKAGIKIVTRMLDVHHIDGDRSNNSLENLEVLCVWCHALKTRKLWYLRVV